MKMDQRIILEACKTSDCQNKSVSLYAYPDLEEHCHVYILDLYLCKLSREALLRTYRASELGYVKDLRTYKCSPTRSCIPGSKQTFEKMLSGTKNKREKTENVQ